MQDNPNAQTAPWYDSGSSMTKNYEGFRPDAYRDPSGTNDSVGYGYNLDANPNLPRHMDQATADKYFPFFYSQAIQTAKKFAGSRWESMNDDQKKVLTDMAYPLHQKLFSFEKMKANLDAGNDAGVQKEMQNSKWFTDVKKRGVADVKEWGRKSKTVREDQKTPLAGYDPSVQPLTNGSIFK